MQKNNELNPIFNILKTEWIFLGKRKKFFLFYVSLFVISGTLGLLNPLIIGLIFNSIQETITSPEQLNHLILMIFLLLFIQIFKWALHGPARIMEQITAFHVHRNYTNSKIKKVLELPVKWHKDHHSGDTIDKINRSREGLYDFSESLTMTIIYAMLDIFGSLIILFFVDFKIAIFSLVFSLMILWIAMGFDKKIIQCYKELNCFSNKLSACIFDYISNIYTVVTLRLKKIAENEVDSRLFASYDIERKKAFLLEAKWGFASIAIMLMTVLALSYKAYTDYYSTGVILIGTLFLLYSYLNRVGNTFFNFANIYTKITKYDSKIQGVYPIDDAYEEIENKTYEKLPSNWKSVKFENYSFTYNDDGVKQHLKNINFEFKRGQKIALIGESGSGKSTLLSLMRGLYLPGKGKSYIDGIKTRKTIERLRQNVTLIPQEPEIFNNTILFNITMGLHVSKSDLQKAINMAQFDDVVRRLKDGLDTNVLEKGVSLSGGEKQRLALARGLLAAKNSDIVLFDEPTSSVDSLNEMKIHQNIFREFKGKTIISSIHRLHLLDKFDYIYMFDHGKIIAEGSLNEIKKNSRFKQIWEKYGVEKGK
ncbi:MAG: xenobiotic-transporting ATPase [archaeon GW2011_AR13]|nr:MAG: xenobiotic-transporting ATPase [archaeon GW2011_AR13]HIG94139.1 ABC transporter ATP-binding protein [Nanoarchaeota archaeon]HIH63932.1 ABC transporter ATP-binding protein [Nanoarchaeota archaeon]HIJ09726.1 ABC transporter ATP-binding protein [Nanoarchaeota archaeon]